MQESVLLFPVPTTPRYNQYQAVFFNFVLLKKNRPGNEASSVGGRAGQDDKSLNCSCSIGTALWNGLNWRLSRVAW